MDMQQLAALASKLIEEAKLTNQGIELGIKLLYSKIVDNIQEEDKKKAEEAKKQEELKSEMEAKSLKSASGVQ